MPWLAGAVCLDAVSPGDSIMNSWMHWLPSVLAYADLLAIAAFLAWAVLS